MITAPGIAVVDKHYMKPRITKVLITGIAPGVVTTRICRIGVIRGSDVEAESAARLVPVCLPATTLMAGAIRSSRRERPYEYISGTQVSM